MIFARFRVFLLSGTAHCGAPARHRVPGFAFYGLLPPLCRFYPLPVRRAPALCFRLPFDSRSPEKPLPSANTCPCRLCRGLSPPSNRGKTVDFLLRRDRGIAAAQAFFRKALASNATRV